MRTIRINNQMAVSKPKRCFINDYNDLASDNINIPKEHLHRISLRHIQNIACHLSPPHTIDGGIYIGGIGVSYMFYRVSKCDAFLKNAVEYLNFSVQYLKPSLASSTSPRDDPTSLILGDAGMYCVAAAVYKRMGDREKAIKYTQLFAQLQPKYLPIDFLKCGGDELFVGRAGYIAGALWLEKEMETQVLSNEALHQICRAIIKSGRQYSSTHKSPCPLMFSYWGTEYVGAAHGLSFILQMLLTVPGFIDSDESVRTDVEASIDYLLSLQTESGNFPCALDEIGEHARSESDELVHWCHGAPGVIYLMAKSYLVLKDEKYLNSCIKSGELVWKKGLLKKGPGICHGIAGNGYVFLLLYRLTEDKKYLHRALDFANFMESKEFDKFARIPDSPYSLFEGVAGTVCYLVDLLEPEKSAFPFHDVFN